MDPRRFDTLAKTLSTSGTRRGALAALLSGSLSLLGVPQGVQGRKRRGGGDVTIEGPCGDGSGAANRCERDRDCCTGLCRRTRSGTRRCRCRKPGGRCTETRNCCQGSGPALTCEGGTCQAACPTACDDCFTCDTTRGQCIVAASQVGSACGKPGQVCQANGTCACEPASCGLCRTCETDGTCSSICGGSGCCDGTTCQLGTADAACGTGGDDCSDCTAQGEVCGGGGTAGVCGCETAAEACGSKICGTALTNCGETVACTGCTGCCSGDTCMAGTTPEFCGKSGADCQACPAPTGGTAVCQADRSCAKTCPADTPILCGNGSQTCETCCGLNTGCAADAGCICTSTADEGPQDCANVGSCTCVDVCEDCLSATKVCLPFGSSMCPGSYRCCVRCRAS